MFFYGLSFVVELLHAIDKEKPRLKQVCRGENRIQFTKIAESKEKTFSGFIVMIEFY